MSKKKRQEHHHQKQQKPAPAPKGNKLIPLLLFVFAFMLYGNTLKHGYLLDDDIVIGKNEFVQQGNKGIKNILTKGSLYGFNKTNSLAYRPVPLVTFALETQYFGNKANVRHFFNVLLYAISCVLLFVLLKKLFAKTITSFRCWSPCSSWPTPSIPKQWPISRAGTRYWYF